MKYFLSNPDQTYIAGPFISVANNSEQFIGQIIRSNEFSTLLGEIKLKLWCTNLDIPDLKIHLQNLLPNLHYDEDIGYIGMFIGILTKENLSLTLVENNKNYIIEFQLFNNIISCPTLLIN